MAVVRASQLRSDRFISIIRFEFFMKDLKISLLCCRCVVCAVWCGLIHDPHSMAAARDSFNVSSISPLSICRLVGMK